MAEEKEIAFIEEAVSKQSGNLIHDILNGDDPLGSLLIEGAWSLLSLLCTVAAIILSIIILATMFLRYKREDEEEQYMHEDRNEEGEKDKRNILLKVLTILVGIVTAIIFFVLDDMSLPVMLINKWTPYVFIAFMVHLVLLLV